MHSSANSLIQSYESPMKFNDELVQHILICILRELRLLIESLGLSIKTIVMDSSIQFIDTLFLTLTHPSFTVRLLTAWCYRSIATAWPISLIPLIEKCLEKIKSIVQSTTSEEAEALSGYALALEALLGSVNRSTLGMLIDIRVYLHCLCFFCFV